MILKRFPYSVLSFITSSLSLIIILDYLLWPKTLKANEPLFTEADQLKFIICIILFTLSLIFYRISKSKESKNTWGKISLVSIIIISTIILGSILFAAIMDWYY